MLTFTLTGAPEGKARPRTQLRGGRPFTPRSTTAYELRVRAAALVALENTPRPLYPWQVVELAIVAVHQRPVRRPASVLVSDWTCGLVARSGKPDADNVLKAIADGLNGVAYTDDAQVGRVVVETYYAELGGQPRVVVQVRQFIAGSKPAIAGA